MARSDLVEATVNLFSQLDLNANILKALQICGYEKPTPIQAQAIPLILEKKDLVACAQTGTGKTAAFVLPALDQLAEQTNEQSHNKKASVLILTPTRELASQITKAISTYSRCMKRVTIANLVGGMPYHHQIRDLERGADLIVATPGRLMDHMENKRVDLSQIKMLILDEADRMLDMGFIDDVQYIANLTPSSRQTLLFSATIDKQLTTVVRRLLKNPMTINLSQEKIAAPHIEQHFYKVTHLPHKIRLLSHLLKNENLFKVIIFSATKINADKLAKQLNDEGLAAAPLHGDLRQNVRNRTIEQFRRGKVHILVATDVAARGLDISDITHVINFDLPKFCEDYVHRIGRTGRAGRAGTAISFILPIDIKHLQRIERYLNQRFKIVHNTDFIEGGAGGSSEGSARSSMRDNQRSFSSEPKSEKSRFHYEKRQSSKSFSGSREGSSNRSGSREEGGHFGSREEGARKERREPREYQERREFNRDKPVREKEGYFAKKRRQEAEGAAGSSGEKSYTKKRTSYANEDSRISYREKPRERSFESRGRSSEKPSERSFDKPRERSERFGADQETFGARKPKAKRSFSEVSSDKPREGFSRGKSRTFKKSDTGTVVRPFSPASKKRWSDKSSSARTDK